MTLRHVVRVAVIASVLVLAACQDMDPYTRANTWQPTGANAGNIAAMVANPYDLIRGRGVDRIDAKASDRAIDHIWEDKPKKLPDIGSMSTSVGSGGSGGGGSGSGSGN